MPATFPSHAAAVLPLKLARPRRFDGVALVLGSTAPDLAYPFAAIVRHPEVHSLAGLFWWCLPVTVALTWVVRRATPYVAAHLPAGGPLALRDYGALVRARHRWYVTGWSALLGPATHLVWDGFTHAPRSSGWMVAVLPGLTAEAVAGVPWYRVLQHASTALGAVAALAFFLHIGRRRLVRRWYGAAPAVARDPCLFWGVAVVTLAGYPLTWPLLTHVFQPHVQGARLLCFAALGLLAGAAAVRLRRAPARGRMDA